MTIPISNFSDLSHFFLASTRPEVSEIELDLSNCQFVEGHTLTCLAQLIIKCKRASKSLHLTLPRNQAVAQYIESIGLRKFVQNNWQQPSEFLPADRNSALGLWRVSKEGKEYFTRMFRDYFDSVDHSKDFTAVHIYFHELISNVYDHAGSTTEAYTFGQYYPKRRNLILVVTDLGIGIPQKVNQYLSIKQLPLLTPSDAVLTAFKPRFTTESHPGNRGAGLDTIKSLVNTLKGSLSVYTDSAFVEFTPSSPNGTLRSPVSHLFGTTFVIDIPVASLNTKESISDPLSFT